jgi:FKBP-type peptidyl-prolyl cis-trans isomerase (trigger factor)|tara:strand:+ start:2082 stop:2333 length:252 start_codon:yes stop_codon:yes gene_type:complete
MYFHPLQEEISQLSDEEISKRIKDLSRKLGVARRTGKRELMVQVQNALQSYQMAIRERRLEEWHKNNKKARGEPDLGELINIE